MTKLQKEAQALRKRFDGIETYYAEHRNMFSVNVKLRGKELDCDIDKAIEVIGIPEKWRERATDALKEYANEDGIRQWSDQCIEDAQHYAKEVLGGCRHDTPEYARKRLEDLKAGKEAGYPYIDNLPTLKARIAEAQKWLDTSVMEAYILGTLSSYIKDMGFYGRGGGHFCIGYTGEIDDMLCSLDTAIEDKEKEEAENLAEAITAELDAIEWALTEVKRIADGVSLQEEVEYRIAEYYENDVQGELEAEDEIAEAKRLAEKHDLIVSKKI